MFGVQTMKRYVRAHGSRNPNVTIVPLQPDEAVRQVMQKTARLILSASNPTQMEMKILVDFGEKEPSFAFLRGRWKHRWKEICSAMSQSLAAEAKAGENSGIGGLADYGDSEDEEPE